MINHFFSNISTAPLFAQIMIGILMTGSLQATPVILSYKPRGHVRQEKSPPKTKILSETELQNRLQRLQQLTEDDPSDWKRLSAIAAEYMAITPQRPFEPTPHSATANHRKDRWNALKLMDRAYRLATEQDISPADYDGLAECYCKILLDAGSNKLIDLNTSYCTLTAEKLTELNFYPRYEPPVFYPIPASYKAAKNDGERARWLISKMSPQKGTRLMADFAAYTAGEARGMQRISSNTGYHPLSDFTDAQTAFWNRHTPTPINLPEDYRYIDQYIKLAESGDKQSAKILGDIFMNRFQQKRAAHYYEMAGQSKQAALIKSKRGAFTGSAPVAAGSLAELIYRYRNGTSIKCSLRRLPVGQRFLQRIKAGTITHGEYNLLRGFPAWFKKESGTRPAGETVWTQTIELAPTPDFRNKDYCWKTPPLKAGVYLASARMKDGNECEIFLNVYDRELIRSNTTPARFRLVDAQGRKLANEPIHILQIDPGKYRAGRFPHKRLISATTLQTDQDGSITCPHSAAPDTVVACSLSGAIPALCAGNSKSSKPRPISAGGCHGIGLRYTPVGLSPENTFY